MAFGQRNCVLILRPQWARIVSRARRGDGKGKPMANLIGELQQTWRKQVWEGRVKAMPHPRRELILTLRIGHLLVRDLGEGQLTLRAMGLVYTTLLAMVPLLAVSFSVLKGFGVHNQIEPALLNLLEPLGEKGVEITQRIIGFVDNTRVGVLGSVGLALLLYTTVSLLQKIERAFNFTWRVATNRPLAQRFTEYVTIIMVGPVLVFSAIGLTGTLSSHTVVQYLMQFEVVGAMVEFAGRLVPYALIALAFTFLYVLVPNTKVKVGAAFIGGIVAGILWQSAGWAVAAFVVNSANYTAIYSAFATLIVFMIWLYLNWLILLIGASVAFYCQNPEYRSLEAQSPRFSVRMKEKVALLIMYIVGRSYYGSGGPISMSELVAQVEVGGEECRTLVDLLTAKGLLLRVAGEEERLVPGRSVETLALADVVRVVRTAGETTNLSPDALPPAAVVDSLFSNIEASIDGALEDATLSGLVRQDSAPGDSPAAQMPSDQTLSA